MNDLLPPVEVVFELAPSENVRALRWHVLHTGGFRWTGPIGLGAAALLVYGLRRSGWVWSSALGLGAVVLAISVLLVTYLFPWIAVWRSPRLMQEYRFVFSNRDIRFETDDRDGRLEWHRYDRWRKTDEFVFLYFDDDHFTLVPRRALDSEAQRDRLLTLLEDHVGPAETWI